jgi:hypothetical protein
MIHLAWSAKIEPIHRRELAETLHTITSTYVIYFLVFLFLLGPIFAAIIVFAYMTLIITIWVVESCVNREDC